jgi:hypothetical protein
MSADLDALARETLKNNDLGGYTIPTKGLYPYQWNWDSVFVAMGFAEFDMDRAWLEIENLFEGQWDDGMVPHILFRQNDPGYFPGPDAWGAGAGSMQTSGHSQPPVAATAVRDLFERAPGEAGAMRARALFPKLMKWHRWFATYRDPDGSGAVAIIHPWESGRDNLPDWDEPLAGVDTSNVKPYARKDTTHVDPQMRPLKKDYDRYMAIVDCGRELGWQPDAVVEKCPFLVADPGHTMILLRANRDLAVLAKSLGFEDQVVEIERWIGRLEEGLRSLWNPDIQAYTSRNLRTGVRGPGVSSAAFLAPYAGVSDAEALEALNGHFDRIGAKARYMVPSYDPDYPGFEHMRYWRGPVWAVVNYMIARGFRETGNVDRAERVRRDTADLAALSGFAEYFSPLDGSGAGGNAFSWTAAVWLAWASPSRLTRAA